MHTVTPRADRREHIRVGLRVVHRHRTGTAVSERVSELLYMKGRAIALLEWIDLGGVRTPLYVCDLDPTKLRPDKYDRAVFHYDGLTTDPRFPASD